MIRLNNIRKDYRMGKHVVHALVDLSVEIPSGAYVAIMGPSGSGKSTLMNILGCLDRPTSGEYLLDGRDVSGLEDDELAEVRNRKLGFVFQSFNLLALSTAVENVALPLVYAGATDQKKRALAALERVGLGGRADHRPSELSGGQRQRVAIARALVTEPPVILADEPTGNLDSRTSEEILALFEGLHESGTTVVMVTHEPDVAQHAQRILRVKDGLLAADELVDPHGGEDRGDAARGSEAKDISQGEAREGGPR
jgi:putative ABC transport system ATP-binding protein